MLFLRSKVREGEDMEVIASEATNEEAITEEATMDSAEGGGMADILVLADATSGDTAILVQ